MNIPQQRLTNQHIAAQSLTTPQSVLEWFAGIQGQDYLAGKWAIALRMPQASDADIERAVTEKTIIRAWLMRGTLHYLSASDLGWMLALLSPRMTENMARAYRDTNLDEATLQRTNKLITELFQADQDLDRTSIIQHIQAHGIDTTGQRAAYMLQRAALDGFICRGISRGSNSTYMRVDPALLHTPYTRDEALTELARRYFTSRAPATLKDFVWWSGLLTADARQGLDSIAHELNAHTIDGKTYWMPKTNPPIPTDAPSTYLLPPFDEYLLGYQDRTDVLERQYFDRIVPGGNGIFNAIIVMDGQVVGIWRRAFKKNKVIITAETFAPFTADQRESFAQAAQAYGTFHNLPVEVHA